MHLKNRLIHIAIAFWKKLFSPHPVDPVYPRYLIVSTTGLGDTLWATPAIKTLRAAEPTAYIAILTRPLGKEILETNPYIDQIFVLKTSIFSKFFLLWKMRRAHMPTALIFHTSQRCVLPLCVMSGASCIIGSQTLNKGLDDLLTKALPLTGMHEIERRIHIVNHILSPPSLPAKHLELFLTPEDHTHCENFLKQWNIPSYIPLIGMHTGAKNTFKHWPPELYIQLAHQLRHHLGSQILLTGSADELPFLQEMVEKIPDAIICTELSVRQLASLIKKCRLFITNDTGPMHIAYALNTPTVALFGPTDPRKCGPYLAPNVSVIKKSPTCSPCLSKKCKTPFCMLQISPDEVFQAALKLFYSPGARYD